jgi:hypothetical protein
MGEKGSSSTKRSFWTTLPGILTALAGIITAIATLITALHGAGLINFGIVNQTNPQLTDFSNIQTTIPTSNPTTISTPIPTTLQPFSFTVVPSAVYPGSDVKLYFDQSTSDIGTIYFDNHPLPKKTYQDWIIVTIPVDASGGGRLKITNQDGQTATQFVTILTRTTIPTTTPTLERTAEVTVMKVNISVATVSPAPVSFNASMSSLNK